MTNALIPVNRSLIIASDARSRAYQHYGVPRQKTLFDKLRSAISTAGSGVGRVVSAVASVPRRFDRAVSSAVGIDLKWSSAALTLGSAGSAFGFRHPIRLFAATRFHDGLGHLKYFEAVNKSIDSVSGLNHRLKYGHTIFWLPDLIRQHGAIAIPGYTLHILQDFTTVAGVPLIPGARILKLGLQRIGLNSVAATGLVTINLAGALGVVSTGLIAYEVGSIGYEIYRQVRAKQEEQRLIGEAT